MTTDDAVLVAHRKNPDALRRVVEQLRQVAPALTQDHPKFIGPGELINRSISASAIRSNASS